MTHQRRKIPAWRRLVELLVFIAGATLIMFVLSAIALVLYTRGVAEPTDVLLIVPDGSALAIAGGDNVLEVPPVWTFNDGDTLTIDNRDSVVHNIGDWSVPTGEMTVIVINATAGGEYLTTLHPQGIVTVSVEPSGFAFSTIAFTTFGFGISVGIIVYIGVSIARAMGHHDDDDWADEPDTRSGTEPATGGAT